MLFQKTLSFCKYTLIALLGMLFLLLPTKNAFAINWDFAKSKYSLSSCFITDKDGSILMIQDRTTGKYYLPGGPVDNEKMDEEKTALYYVTKDTGFDAILGYKLAQVNNHAIYACALSTPRSYAISPKDKKVIIEWANLLASKSVSQPILMPNDEDTLRKYAFFEETKYFDEWIEKTVPSRFILIKDGIQLLPKYYQKQHEWLVDIRDWALNYKLIAHFATLFPTLSNIFFPLLFIISIPFFRAYYGFRPLLIYSVGLVYLGLFAIALSNYLPMPPPFFVDQTFITQQQFFFSIPATEVIFFAFVFSWLIVRLPKGKYIKEKIGMGLFGAIFICMGTVKASIYGENYPSTIVISILIAIIWSLILRACRKIRLGDRKRALVTVRFWSLTAVIIFVLADLIDTVRINYLQAFCLGVATSLMLLKLTPNYIMVVRAEIKLPFFISSVIGLLIIFYITTDQFETDTDRVSIFMSKMFLMPIWLMLINPWLFRRYFVKQRKKTY